MIRFLPPLSSLVALVVSLSGVDLSHVKWLGTRPMTPVFSLDYRCLGCTTKATTRTAIPDEASGAQKRAARTAGTAGRTETRAGDCGIRNSPFC
ncbi:hypothetical protein GQ53DRAFT_743805 [Thozetella sp. PMI_491]|nr:hypothetical protein GQ53DRAFT_743805 [Thozetella sp. PMI_491]